MVHVAGWHKYAHTRYTEDEFEEGYHYRYRRRCCLSCVITKSFVCNRRYEALITRIARPPP